MSHYARWRARLARLLFPRLSLPEDRLKLLIVVEGVHDIAFLRGISATLHARDSDLPDLGAMEHRGELVFIPFGGADLHAWTHRLAPLGRPEVHIYDREDPPESDLRWQAARSVNARPRCTAVVTSKRSMENYLHPAAIQEAGGIDVEFGDDDDVADAIAQLCYSRDCPDQCWTELPRRAKTRRRNRIKRWLNRSAVARMTPERLAQQDPAGEVRSWLEAVLRLIHNGT